MRSALALLLSFTMCLPTFGRGPSITTEQIRQRVSKMQPGTKVTVYLLNKEKVKGVLTGTNETAMEVVGIKGAPGAKRTIPFDQIRDVSTPLPKWGVITLTVVAVVGILIVVGFTIPDN